MGYDMYTVDYHGCAFPEHHNDHYLHRAAGNGLRLATQLVAAGLGSWGDQGLWDAAEEAGYPVPPEGVIYDGEEDMYNGPGAAEYQKKLDAYLSDRRGVRSGIAVWKLAHTNDGWWVTKRECQEAMAAYHANPDAWAFEVSQGGTARDDVLAFIQAGADHNGFTVH